MKRHSRLAIAAADVVGRDKLRVGIDLYPCPDVASTRRADRLPKSEPGSKIQPMA
jgi:hypothetical protein